MMNPTLFLILNAPGGDEAWFEGVLRWLVEGSPRAGDHSQRTERLAALNGVLERDPRGPEWRTRIRTVWSHTSAVRLLADTGLPAHTAFLREVVHRMVERFVPRLDPETARHSLHSLHPLRSWTLPFAALTGVFLWMSSLAAGWAANWSAFRCLPQALAGHRRLIYWLGPERAATAGRLVQRHLGGVCGYVALGFLLGFMPVVFTFMGLALEVRHVTLSAASLALCAAQGLLAAGPMPWAGLAWAMAGIAGIGVLNFGVSFLLALRTAIGARDVDRGGRKGLRRLLWTAFRENPWHFIGPPANDAVGR